MKRTITISFDMDGTLNNMYSLPNWVEQINNGIVTPYVKAKPAFNFAVLAKLLNRLQEKGYKIQVITWLSKTGTVEYNTAVTKEKKKWLQKHLPSVIWDEIHIVPYGTPKENYCYSCNDILFDDNTRVRSSWTGQTYDEKNIVKILEQLLND